MNEQYLIESMEHTYDDTIAWWKPNRMGYTIDVDQAGRYSYKEASDICERAGAENERMWSESQVNSGKAGIVCRTVTKR